MKITLKDGSVMEFEQKMSVLDVAKSISEGLARVATSAKVDGDIVDLRTVLDKDCELEILTFDSEDGNGAFNHTAAHIMAQAVNVCIRRQNWQSDLLLLTVFTMIWIVKLHLQQKILKKSRKK